MGKAEDLTGQQFNELFVLSLNLDKTKKMGYRYYDVLCSCGNKTVVRGSCLKSGHTKSCGCLQKKKVGDLNRNKYNDLTGQRFHKLVALSLNKAITEKEKNTYWDFRCDCGNIKTIRASNVLSGQTKSCGCIKTSYGEELIEQILKNNKIQYQKEFIFKDFKSPKGEYFRYDFAIFNHNNQLAYVIEFHGEQHYKPIKFFDQKITFETRQYYDQLKQEYCQNKNIPLIIINFSEEINNKKVIKEELL